MTNLRIYVACLASYNNGVLHGEWIDVDGKDADDLQQEINDRILRTSRYPNVMVPCPDCEGTGERNGAECPRAACGGSGEIPSAEEWAIHDHEGFGDLLGEYSPLEDVAAIAAVLDDGDEDKRRGLLWLVGSCGYKVADAIDRCDEVRTFDGTPTEYAEQFADDVYSEAELGPLASYIDYERFARDMMLGGDIAEADVAGERFIVTNANEF
jgi:antirestriction protein